jgi:acyl-coenzyme A thioesterase 13
VRGHRAAHFEAASLCAPAPHTHTHARSMTDGAPALADARTAEQFFAEAVRAGTYDSPALARCRKGAFPKLGAFTCELEVTSELTNRFGTLHGGCVATLVDVLTTVALLTVTKQGGVSTDLNVSYCAPAPTGSRVLITCEVLKVGKTLAWMECVLKNEDGDVIATGRHTKFLPVAMPVSKL